MNNCGKRIVEKMVEHDMNVRQLSEVSGVSRTAIYHFIKGVTTPNAHALKSMADTFGVTMDWLWGE